MLIWVAGEGVGGRAFPYQVPGVGRMQFEGSAVGGVDKLFAWSVYAAVSGDLPPPTLPLI